MNQEPASRPKRLLEEHAPPVIHEPDQDQTALYRWMRQTLERGPMIWVAAAVAIVVVCLAWIFLVGSGSSNRSATARAWSEMILAKNNEDQIKVGESAAAADPGPAGGWALLRSAELQYAEALSDLPGNRDAALPLLGKARDLFRQASQRAGTEAGLRALADMGVARVLEARGELGEAVQEYKRIAESFPGTDEGRRAKALAEELAKPEAIAFYQKFSNFKPPRPGLPAGPGEMFLPPGGSSSFPLPGLPAGHPSLEGPTIPAPALIPPAPAPAPTPAALPEPAKSGEAKGELPAEPFATPSPEKKDASKP